jgi:hypothetical protein
MVLALVSLVALSLALLPSALLHGTTAGATGQWWWSTGGVLVRALGMVAISATIGFSIASMGRNTAAALAALFAYVVVIERLVAALVTGWQPWLIIANAAIFVSGKRNDVAGNRSVAAAGIYLAAIGVGLYAVAAADFQRRDVA